ncbi:MAG: HlyD family efflux transporter periplasmic adaptor subunit [Planctomycetota bacterium]
MASAPTIDQRSRESVEPPAQPTTPRTGAATKSTDVTTSEPTEQLWEAARSARSLAEFYGGALRVLADRFDAPYAAITAQRKSDTINKSSAASESAKAWAEEIEAVQLDARYRSTPLARIVTLGSVGRSFAALATPLSVEGEGVVGSVGVAAPIASRDGAEAKLGELKALTSLIGVLAAQVGVGPPQPAATSASDSGEGLQQAARYRSASEYAYSVTNGLKTKLNVAQASLGVVRGRRVEIVCISGFDRVEKQAAGVRAIQQAMDECLDIKHCVVSQAKTPKDGADYLLHKAWRGRCDGDAVATIPIEQEGRVVAVLGLQHRSGESFAPEHLAKVLEKLTPVIGGYLLLCRSERPLVSHLLESLRDGVRRVRNSGWRRRVAMAAVAVAIGAAVFGKQAYVFSSPATLQASDVRQIAAPFAGTIAVCHARPGDRIAAGQPILEFDTSSLEADRAQAESELSAARSMLRSATSVDDLAIAATARADAVAAQSRLTAINDKLARARVVAEADTVVLSGDVRPRVGESVPLGEPLLEIATGDAKRIDVFVDEASTTLLEVGQPVRFAINARPSDPLTGVIERIDASSTVHESKNAFRATVAIDGESPAWAIAGMEGVARIETGPQPIWWVWCHRVIDAVRIQWWKL